MKRLKILTLLISTLLFNSCGQKSITPEESELKIEIKTSALSKKLEKRAKELRKKYGEKFHVVVEEPFIVLGDEDPEIVVRRSMQTVQWAVKLLKKDYFKKDPDDIVNIWLFKNAHSYIYHVRKLFNDTPSSRYGYYSPKNKVLVMNISTGGGTLVHEIVHPFMAANFENCPHWFNEGLASLYEQSGEKGGKIVGYTNWRLPILQKAIKNRETVSFYNLFRYNYDEFYRSNKGANYAQARYLCYYLQEKGLLRRFYHSFVANAKSDPTGYATLKKLLGKKELASFKNEWEKWVLTLKR